MKGCLFLIMLPFLLPIVIAAVFIVKIFLKGKAEGWRGEIIDKGHNTKHDDEHPGKVEHLYSFKCKMTDGKIRNIAVSNQLYSECTIGDIIEKPKGAVFPKKVIK